MRRSVSPGLELRGVLSWRVVTRIGIVLLLDAVKALGIQGLGRHGFTVRFQECWGLRALNPKPKGAFIRLEGTLCVDQFCVSSLVCRVSLPCQRGN